MEQTLNVRGRLMSLERPVVMGILNATPDSFYAGSRVQTEREIALRAQQIVAEGGTIIDIGAFSTRPGASEVAEADEAERLRSALLTVRRELPDVAISVDTFRPQVARKCIEWGADIINDVSEGGLAGIAHSPLGKQGQMFATVAELRVPYILTSVRPDIQQMLLHFSREIDELHSLGVSDIIVDPGFGFGKTTAENFAVMRHLDALHALGCPLLVGVSRKSMIYKTLDTTPDEALTGTTVLHTLALEAGAKILRTHDVKEACEAVAIMEQVQAQQP